MIIKKLLFLIIIGVVLRAENIDRRVFEIFEGDLNGDGTIERVFKVQYYQTFELHIESNYHKLIVPLGPTENIYVKDIDKDGIYEIVSYDSSSYSMIFGLCRACSPAIKYIAHYIYNKLILQPRLMKIQTQKFNFVPLKLNKYGSLEIDLYQGDMFKHSKVIETILSYLYVGDKQKAAKLINHYIWFQSKSMKVLFLQDLVEAMSRSYFWEQIKQINNWEEFQNFEVVSKLFERLEAN